MDPFTGHAAPQGHDLYALGRDLSEGVVGSGVEEDGRCWRL